MRSHYCGDVDQALTGQEVAVAGWVHRRRDHGGVIFVDLRDREGLLQVVFDPDAAAVFADAERLRNEFVIRVVGRVRARPAGTANTQLFYHHGKLLVFKEDSPPVAMNPLTLETTDDYYTFGGLLKSQTHTAHPKIDPMTGEQRPVPYGFGIIRLDGSSTSMFHFVDETDDAAVGPRGRQLVGRNERVHGGRNKFSLGDHEDERRIGFEKIFERRSRGDPCGERCVEFILDQQVVQRQIAMRAFVVAKPARRQHTWNRGEGRDMLMVVPLVELGLVFGIHVYRVHQ